MTLAEINADLSHHHRLQVGILNYFPSPCLYREKAEEQGWPLVVPEAREILSIALDLPPLQLTI